MRKYIAILLVLFFTRSMSLVQAQAQDDKANSRTKFSLGIKAGLNSSNVWDEEGQDFEAQSKYGFAGGGFVGISIGRFLGFQPEVLISQKGFQGSGTMFSEPYSITKTTTYLDVPLQLQIRPIRFITLLVGPQYSYLMREKTVTSVGSTTTQVEQEFENDNLMKNTLGFVAGVDVNIFNLVFSGRIGIDFQTNNGDGSSYTPRYKNQWLQCTLGFRII